MKLLSQRSGLVLLIAGLCLTLPTVLLLNGRASSSRPNSRAVAISAGPLAGKSDLVERRELQLVPTPSADTAVTAPSPSGGQATPAVSTSAASRPTSATAHPASVPPAVSSLPAFSHIFTIVMENEESNSVVGNLAAPYINGLASRYGLATNYYAISHPSLPNYLALTAGSTFGINSDCTTCYLSATNIADQVEASGRSWRAYMEDMPSACYTGASSGNYAMKHDPFMYYNDIRNNAARCAAHVVPFTQFSVDMGSGHVPNYVFITPNMCHDMHDCPVSTGDAWLQSVVPTITSSPAFQNGGVLFITWDEGASGAGCCGDSSGGRVATMVISPAGIAGYRSSIAENHYSLLRTIEDAWHLGHLGAAGFDATTVMREYFRH
jgi:hypothetical protein